MKWQKMDLRHFFPEYHPDILFFYVIILGK